MTLEPLSMQNRGTIFTHYFTTYLHIISTCYYVISKSKEGRGRMSEVGFSVFV